MARSEKQKLKLLYIAEILHRETDENHGLTIAELIDKLAEKGVSAERKALYSDFLALEEFGIYVEKTGDHRYYIAERDFELAELKVLVDIIQSSQFLSEKKSRELTKKLYKQTSIYGATELERQVHTACAKAKDEKIFYTIDSIHAAIRDDKKILFSYLYYGTDKTLAEKRKGYKYSVSPLALIFDNENYYLVAYSEADSQIRHYRVDRMQHTSVSEDSRSPKEIYGEFDISKYENKTFGMFGGKEELITLECENKAAGAIIDRFSNEPTFINHGDRFDVTVRVFVSEQFYGWVCGLGRLIKIKSPAYVAEDFKSYLKSIIEK